MIIPEQSEADDDDILYRQEILYPDGLVILEKLYRFPGDEIRLIDADKS